LRSDELLRRHVYRRGVCFQRSRAESDRLAAAVGELYRAKLSEGAGE
jgi:hypothetical protein